jgi:hypothetical protein
LTSEAQPLKFHVPAAAGLAFIAGLAGGCGGAAPATDAQSRITPAYDGASGRLTRLAYDSNDNGKDDTWASMDGTRLTKLEADENEDGRIDRWEYYPASATGGPRQPPERIERATRLDGQVSRREYFEHGVLTRIEEDTDGNGAVDKWETYADGSLTTLALDTSGRGKPDRRLIYRTDGSLDRIEADPAGTGQFEVVK